MDTKTKKCERCGIDFEITEEDFEFYKKINVPAPTWCVDCRFQRRMTWRNERHLYKRKCDADGHDESLVSMYAPEADIKTYDTKYWWSDNWDPMDYGRVYDFSKPFFQQFAELQKEVPFPILNTINNVESDYVNYASYGKNNYLVFGGDFSEHCCYSTFNFNTKESGELYFVDNCELCYECVDANNCYKTLYSRYVNDCSNCSFMYNCTGCSDCLGCVNLRKKKYHIFNQPYSKEEYEEKVKSFRLNTREGIENFRKQFEEFKLTKPFRYAQIIKSTNCTGDTITNAKNCNNCFDVTGPAEDIKDSVISGWGLRDARGVSHTGHDSETAYDSWGVFSKCRNVALSMFTTESYDIRYSYICRSSHDLFGCIGLRNKEYCILNKQYSKEEYEELMPRIRKHMEDMPYKDKADLVYKYGQFFPSEISPFFYNHSVAQEYFPLDRKKVEELGLQWEDVEEKNYQATMSFSDLSEKIEDEREDITKQVVICRHEAKCNESCTKAFRVVPQEIQLYKQLNIPVPDICSNCRHYQRFNSRNPIKLYERRCMCDGAVYKNEVAHDHQGVRCENKFKTSFAPDRKEIVYCEQCYQKEVV